MLLDNTRSALHRGLNNCAEGARNIALDVLCHRYVREKQHVMRFRQQAARVAYDDIRRALLRIAAKEAVHLRAIEESIINLGGKLPTVIGFHCSHDNA